MEKSLIEILNDQYKNQPEVKLFVEAIAIYSGFPLATIIDTFVGNKAKELALSRMRSFYDELNNGEVKLDETIIENNDFLHSYFAVVNYVIRSKSDEKASRFAKIIKSLYKKDVTLDQFEDYTSIFNELTEREFTILCIKREYERNITPNLAIFNLDKPRNSFQITSEYWDKFVKEVTQKLNIEKPELEAFLFRLQRTGCYMLHTGYYDIKNDGCGDTTIIFQKIYDIVKD